MWHNEISNYELETYRDIGFKRKTPARDGSYRFEGEGLVTVEVQRTLKPVEVFSIVDDLRGAVEKQGGLDFLQVFESNAGKREVWAVVIDDNWMLLTREEALTSPLMTLAVSQTIPVEGLACTTGQTRYDVAYG